MQLIIKDIIKYVKNKRCNKYVIKYANNNKQYNKAVRRYEINVIKM